MSVVGYNLGILNEWNIDLQIQEIGCTGVKGVGGWEPSVVR